MKWGQGIPAVVVATAVLWSLATLAQPQATPVGCDAARVPLKVEGQVVSIDREQGKVTVRTDNGTLHEFRADQATLQALKAGSPIELKLRQAPENC